MRPGGTLGAVEKVDDATVKFSFSAPHGLFLKQLGSSVPGSLPTIWSSGIRISIPKGWKQLLPSQVQKIGSLYIETRQTK